MQPNNQFQPFQPKKTHKVAKALFGFIIVLLVVSCAGLGWFTYSNLQHIQRQNERIDLLGEKADIFQAELNETKTELESVSRPNEPAMTDEQAIETATLLYLEDPEGDETTLTIDQQEGDFVRVQYVTEAGPGGYVILKYIDSTWTVLLSENGESADSQAIIEKYDIPTAMLE
jgi:hypothetical protein